MTPVFRQTPGIAEGFAQQEFQLTIDAAQFVIGPAAQGSQDLRIDAEQE